MSDETVVRMPILRATDTPAISTILEEMFQYFDGGVRSHANYEGINRNVRLRWAVMVFGDVGYARLDVTKPRPMIMPTAKLLKALDVQKLTTDLEPLVLRPSQGRLSEPEARKQLQYTQAVGSATGWEMANFLHVVGTMLKMWEMGWLRQSRTSNGNLVWKAKESATAGSYEHWPQANERISRSRERKLIGQKDLSVGQANRPPKRNLPKYLQLAIKSIGPIEFWEYHGDGLDLEEMLIDVTAETASEQWKIRLLLDSWTQAEEFITKLRRALVESDGLTDTATDPKDEDELHELH